jgi:hypothetical protein
MSVKSPVFSNNREPFSSSSISSRYHTVEPYPLEENGNLANAPRGSHRIRPPHAINVDSTRYLRFSVPDATSKLDLTKIDSDKASVFPKNIYVREPVASHSPSLEKFRDATLLYTYSPDPNDCKERNTHTMNASRFGYDRFPETYEYGVGMQSRGYVEPTNCHACANDTPKDMAPQKFYDEYHFRHTPTEYRKIINQQPSC